MGYAIPWKNTYGAPLKLTKRTVGFQLPDTFYLKSCAKILQAYSYSAPDFTHTHHCMSFFVLSFFVNLVDCYRILQYGPNLMHL